MVERQTKNEPLPGRRGAPARRALQRLAKTMKGSKVASLDRLIHERQRLGIISALAVNQALTFNELKDILEISDGNLSDHSRKLENAGYIDVQKGYEGRKPQTVYRLTTRGRSALKHYVATMQAVIDQASGAL